MQSILFTIPFLNFDVPAFGVMMMIGVVGGVWWASQRAEKVKLDGELIVNLGLVVLICGIAGARAFYVIHYWEQFEGKGLWTIINVRQGGIEFYGGFIGGLLATLGFMWYHKLPPRLVLDILMPSVAFGLAMGRIGCFMHGCCWGAVCTTLPWAVTFPIEAPSVHRHFEELQLTFPQEHIEIDEAGRPQPILNRQQWQRHHHEPTRSAPVHPAQLYASVDAFFLAFVLNLYFYRRKRDGSVFAWFLIAYPVIRFVEEAIRGDNPHDTLNLTISQFVSVVLLLIGIAILRAIRHMPAHCEVPESALSRQYLAKQQPQQPAPNPKKSKKNKRKKS